MLLHARSNTARRQSQVQIVKSRSTSVEKMSSPLYSVLVLGIVGLLLVSPREVGAQSSGGEGHSATSLCAELIIPNVYNCDEYQVVTDDGFILGIQNIPCARGFGSAPNNGQPVLLQHGLITGGDNWVVNGPQESLAFILADAGFDVWIMNSRTIQWSHGHKTFTPSENAYWAWTYDELASFDLKASTEFVYNKRGGKKLSFIGHSLGTTILLAGLTDGRFNKTVLGYLNAAVMLAPIVVSTHSTALLLLASILNYSSPAVYEAGAKEYSTYAQSQLECGPPVVNVNPALCSGLFTLSLGIEKRCAHADGAGPSSYTNVNRLGFYSQYFPQPTSTYNINHLGQGYLRNNFAFYDKGTKDNEASYMQPTPPNYDLASFPASLPTQYWIGGIDGVADPIDAENILASVPSSNREDHRLSNYGHTDFILGDHAYIDVYPSLIKFLQKHE